MRTKKSTKPRRKLPRAKPVPRKPLFNSKAVLAPPKPSASEAEAAAQAVRDVASKAAIAAKAADDAANEAAALAAQPWWRKWV